MELATSYMQELKIQRALALFDIALNHIKEFYNDQYEFYTYSMRKFSLKQLEEVIRANDIKHCGNMKVL